jgi:hypothetical protein
MNPAPSLRLCLDKPIPEIAVAARFLNEAVSAHLAGDYTLAEELICRSDMPAIREWMKSMWADSRIHLRVPKARPALPLDLRSQPRMPVASVKRRVHERDGFHCRFCGIPVIRPETRARINARYPKAVKWGRKESVRHPAFQAMWAQYDHLVPHSHGGTSDFENLVLTCAACNLGRAGYTLEEVGVADPRSRPRVRSEWDGLERFL